MFLFSCSYGLATGTIWLNNVRCSGTESRLFSCSKSFYHIYHNCDHYKDVAIDCNSSGNHAYISYNFIIDFLMQYTSNSCSIHSSHAISQSSEDVTIFCGSSISQCSNGCPQGRREDSGVPGQIKIVGPHKMDCGRGGWRHAPRKLRFYML